MNVVPEMIINCTIKASFLGNLVLTFLVTMCILPFKNV